jgi:hypothetical protein
VKVTTPATGHAQEFQIPPAEVDAFWDPKRQPVELDKTELPVGLTYGLINVRTDGKHIMCGYRLEKTGGYDVLVFKAGVDVPGACCPDK